MYIRVGCYQQMKPVPESLANELVQTLGFKSIHDSDTVILREDIENALRKLDPKLLTELGDLYKNRVGERVSRGVTTRQELMCLVRRVLKRHNIMVAYEKKFKQRTAYFKYRLVC